MLRIESVSILAVCLAFCLMELRSGLRGCAACDLSLTAVPAGYLLTDLVLTAFFTVLPVQRAEILCAAVLISAVAGTAAAFLAGELIQSRKTKLAHRWISVDFSLILGIIYIFKIVF